ncbi:MAG TPA: hypothetical protein VKE71_04435 [Candidatus Angelobacter sp.]|nr:hypothetical protein [Candidatus Angelobacter sp.]
MHPYGKLGRAITSCVFVFLIAVSVTATAQTRDLTVDVLVNSTNSTGYNTNSASPGEYQRSPERYLEHLQVPYRVIDVSATSPPDLTQVPLIIAGHRGLNLSTAWQQAIQTAVQGGTGFVNLDWDTAIGTNSHIQAIFGATGSTSGTAGTSITVPAAVLSDGATPHYITALQSRWPVANPASAFPADLVYSFHQDDNGAQGTATCTLLTNGHGTVLAKIGSDPLLTVTTFGSGRAVHFGTYDYLRADRFGFVMGIDDLFWRSLVWAARKPFVLRGYPRYFAIQQDDPADGWSTRVNDMFNTSLTGTVAADGTGGPWKVTGMFQESDSDLNPGSQERQLLINYVNAGNLKLVPHTNTGGSGGDLYWTGQNSSQLTDSQWLANLNNLAVVKQGAGPNGSFNGTSDVLTFGAAMVPHFWDLSNNTGADMWNTLGIRYITEIQQPGVYYSGPCKTPAQRLQGKHPFRVYEQPPTNCNPNEIYSVYWADDYTVGSRAGLAAKTFFGFATQLQGAGYPAADARWPQVPQGITPALGLENWQAYTWRFWSSMAPVQIYNHDGGSMANSTTQERQGLISSLSPWLASRGVRHLFMEDMGAYLRARTKSTLTTGSVSPSTITLNFTGSATDANGAIVATNVLVFYGNDEGTSVNVPGFSNGTSVSFPNVTPPSLALSQNSLNFAGVPGGSNPPPQQVTVSNGGAGTLNWTASSSASWLSVSPGSGTNTGPLMISVNLSGLAQGTYTGTITVSASGATDSPQPITVTLVVSPAKLGVSPTSMTFSGFLGQPDPAAKPLTISNLGGGTINWSATTTGSFLSLSSTAGAAPSTTNVQASISGLGMGTYSGSVTVTGPGAQSSPQTVPVTLNVSGLLMSSNFSDGTMQGWAISPLGKAQNWTVANSAIQYNGGGHTQIYAGDGAWANYDLQVAVKLATLSDYPGGIRGRVNPNSGASYALWLYPNEKLIKLYRTVAWNIDSGFTLLGQASFTFDTASFHTFELLFNGSAITALVDGNSLISVTDNVLPSGMVALDTSNQVITFTNITVSSLVSNSDTMSSSASSLSYTAPVGGANPPAQSFTLNSSGGVLAWTAKNTASWLTLTPTSGNTGTSISASVNTGGLAVGTYNDTITAVSKGAQNSPVTISVQLTVAAQPTILAASPSSLNFFGATTLNPASQNTTVSNAGSGVMNWTGSTDSTWLSASPTSGAAPTTISVTANSSSLAVGQYNGNLILSSTGATNTPLNVPVSLYVGTLLFSDNFSSGNSNNWLISPLGHAADWSVVNGFFTYDGAGPTQAYTGSQGWTDYSFSADFKLSTTSNYPGGIRARLNLTTGAGYAVWFYPGSGFVRLYSVGQWNIDAGFATLAQAPLTFDTNIHNVRIDLKGSTITVYYDNKQIIQVTDATYASGGVAFDVSSQPIQYTNARVTSF